MLVSLWPCCPQLHPRLVQLGAAPLCELGLADDSVARTAPGTSDTDWTEWRDAQLLPALVRRITQPLKFQQQADAARKRRQEEQQRDKEREEREAEEANENTVEDVGAAQLSGVLDVEELGLAVSQKAAGSTRPVQPVESSSVVQLRARPTASLLDSTASAPIRPMLTDQLRAALSKQGYKLLGSHSGVKLCRWTKAMLRGRGACYKNTSAHAHVRQAIQPHGHTGLPDGGHSKLSWRPLTRRCHTACLLSFAVDSFYGIESYQCMEVGSTLSATQSHVAHNAFVAHSTVSASLSCLPPCLMSVDDSVSCVRSVASRTGPQLSARCLLASMQLLMVNVLCACGSAANKCVFCWRHGTNPVRSTVTTSQTRLPLTSCRSPAAPLPH